MILGSSCSQTKRLTEGEVLYTGVKKMNIETAKGVKLEGPKSSAISGPLGFPPNNPLYAPYIRSPFPVGLWVYNWNVKKEMPMGMTTDGIGREVPSTRLTFSRAKPEYL